MDTNTEIAIRTIWHAIDVFTSEDMESQDRDLTLDMTQSMLWDLVQLGHLRPTVEYVKHYSDVLDDEDGANTLATQIDNNVNGE